MALNICGKSVKFTLSALAGFMVIGLYSSPALAGKLGPCLDNQAACNKVCIAKGDMACLERCGSEAEMCLERESQTSSTGNAENSASSRSTNNDKNLQGCWRSAAKLTTWCFTGTTSEITTEAYAGSADGKRITGLNRVTLSGSSMTYYIVRAAMTGPGAYDSAVNKGPYTQAYTYSKTTPPSFYAAGDKYVKQ